jgi:hypothetical protein
MKPFVRLPLVALIFVPSILKSATFTVINTNSSGAGSLLQAILDANANPARTPSPSTSARAD